LRELAKLLRACAADGACQVSPGGTFLRQGLAAVGEKISRRESRE